MKNEDIIRVILADDHAAVRRGIRRILEKAANILVIGEASTGMGAIQLVQELKPDVLLLDMQMPEMSGICVTQELRSRGVPISILILSSCDDDHVVAESLRMGADGYLDKSEKPARIREAIFHISEKANLVTIGSLVIFLLTQLGLTLARTVGPAAAAALDGNLF